MKRIFLSLLTIFVVVVPATFAQWQQVLTGFPYAHHRIMAIDVVNQNVIWAATDTLSNSFSSRVLLSTDGGQSWTTNVIPGSQTQYILDLDAVDANTAWVATNEFNFGGGSMYKTTNGGSTWTLQRNGSFLYVHFFDAQNGVGVVNRGPALTTSNGGTTWTDVPNVPPYDNDEYNIISSGSNTHAQSGDTIWIPTSKGRVYRSTNRGYAWTASQTALGRNACITSVGFKDGRNGLAISSLDSNINITPNRLARTNDGGITWTEVTAPSSPTGNSLAYIPGTPGTYLLVGGVYSGDVPGCTYTTDNGTTWITIDTNPYNALMFMSPTIGWAGALTTNDGMYKWTGNLLVPPQASTQWQLQTTISGNPPLYSINTVSDRVAWMGSFDTLYRTTNGGANWIPTPTRPTSTEDIACIEGLSATTAFVGGGGPGGGGGNAKIYRTTNGGQNWSIVYTATGTASYWNAIHFFDAQNAIAFSDAPNPGNAFLIVKSTDAGATWTPIANRPNGNTDEFGYQNMYFYDSLNGWFGTGSTSGTTGGRVFRTTDGGNTWTGFASGNTGYVTDVRFVSPLIGIRASLTSPRLTRSTDGGQTWTPVNNLPVTNIASIVSGTGVNTSNGSQLWVDGFTQTGGRFMLTSVNGGATWSEQTLPTLPASHLPYLSAVSFGASNDSVRVFGATIDHATFTGGGQVLTYRQRVGYVTGIDEATSLPTEYGLSQNYPNPFNPSTKIGFRVTDYGLVTLTVYDVLGREVQTLVNEEMETGIHSVEWNAAGAASGVYFYRLQAGSFVETKKMLLLR